MGTVLRYGRRRRKSSAGSAASRRFFGRPSVGGGRTAGGGRTNVRRFLDIGQLTILATLCFGEAVASRFPRKRRRQAQESKRKHQVITPDAASGQEIGMNC